MDKCKQVLNTCGSLVLRWWNYHPKQSLSFLSCFLFACSFVSSFPFLIYKQLVRKEVFPIVAWNIANWSQSSEQWVHTEAYHLVVERAWSKFISVSSESKPNSDSSDEKQMILKQNLDVLVPKYIGTISFVFPFSRANTESWLRCHCVWFLGRRHQQPPPQTPWNAVV